MCERIALQVPTLFSFSLTLFAPYEPREAHGPVFLIYYCHRYVINLFQIYGITLARARPPSHLG